MALEKLHPDDLVHQLQRLKLGLDFVELVDDFYDELKHFLLREFLGELLQQAPAQLADVVLRLSQAFDDLQIYNELGSLPSSEDPSFSPEPAWKTFRSCRSEPPGSRPVL